MPRYFSKSARLGDAHHRIQSLLAVGLVIAVTFAWSAGATATKRASAPARTALITPSAVQVRHVITPAVAGDPFSELQAGLMSRYPNSFGGFYVNNGGQYVIATAGPPNAALQRSARTGFTSAARVLGAVDGPIRPIQLTYVDTGVSLWHLYDLKASILDNPSLTTAGVDGAGLDIEHGRLVVMSRTRLGATAVTADYGSAVKVLVDSGSGLYASRYGDTAPFNGGDQIVTPSGGETTCTSGFGMQDTATGQQYLLTAGHCGSATWYNTRTGSPVYDSSTLIGATVRGSVVTSVIDAQLVSTKASCISWGGRSTKPSNDVRAYITGYLDPPQGAEIQTDGSVSTEETGTVAYYDTSLSTGGENLQDLDLITPMGTFGDSGGPMIYPTAYGSLAGGTIVGWYESGDQGWGIIQLIDAEVFTYSAFMGHQIVPITSSTGDSC